MKVTKKKVAAVGAGVLVAVSFLAGMWCTAKKCEGAESEERNTFLRGAEKRRSSGRSQSDRPNLPDVESVEAAGERIEADAEKAASSMREHILSLDAAVICDGYDGARDAIFEGKERLRRAFENRERSTGTSEQPCE